MNQRQLDTIKEMNQKKCEACKDLDELEREYPDEIHHGAVLNCGECNAEYYEAWGGEIFTCNTTAKINYPKLKYL